jgi:hypothetical protein
MTQRTSLFQPTDEEFFLTFSLCDAIKKNFVTKNHRLVSLIERKKQHSKALINNVFSFQVSQTL